MLSHSLSRPALPSLPLAISLQDVIDDRYADRLSEYMALSVRCVGDHLVISLSTTNPDPVTYSTVVSAAAAMDLASLMFVMQDAR